MNVKNVTIWIERIPTFVVVFVFLFLQTITYVPDGNEETYLQFSKQFINPHWIVNSFSITEFPGARLLYEYICGWALQFVSFEFLVFFLRTLFCLMYAYAIHNISSLLKVSIYQWLLILQITLWVPSFFSGENIFVGAEPKHFAYLFILFAIQYLLMQEYIKMLFLIIAASLFHILVGGWFFAALCIYFILFKQKSIFVVIGYGFTYLTLLSPLIYYLMQGIHIDSDISFNGLVADNIYAFYRTPHHTGLFKSLDYFYHEHLNGVLALIFSLLLVTIVYKNEKSKNNRLIQFIIALGILLLFNLTIASFDKEGHFVKYYPFRMTAVYAFLFYVFVITYFIQSETIQLFKNWILILVFVFSTLHIGLLFYKTWFKKTALKDFEATTTFIKNNTPKQSVFFYHTNNDDYTLQFTRLTERDRYVVFKFAPAGTNKIYEWYRRMMVADSIVKQPALIFNEQQKVPIDYYLSENEIDNPRFNLVYSNNHYNLYQLTK
jgi:hypothetical protein